MRETSIIAARSVAESADQMRSRVLVAIREAGGATCDEVEVSLGFRHQTASARIRELQLEGKVYDSGTRRKTRSGRPAVVWVEDDGAEPLLKWAGGKRFLVPKLCELYAEHRHRRLVEPFVGGMAVALGLRPEQALLQDVNPHLVNLYRWLQRGLVPKMEMRNEEKFYYERRDDFNALVEAEEFDTQIGAELFYYLNRTCFNGLCRFNSSGKFNVPFGKYKKINYRTDFSEYVAALAGWQLACCGFETTSSMRREDFIYLDPPYDCDFVDYSTDGFLWEQQVELAELYAKHEGPVVASNACTARVLNLYDRLGFEIHLIAAPRRISANGSRDAVLEMLAIKNLTWR